MGQIWHKKGALYLLLIILKKGLKTGFFSENVNINLGHNYYSEFITLLWRIRLCF